MWFKGNKTAKEKEKKLFPSFANSMGQSCRQSWACSPAKHASFANRDPLPTALSIAVLLAKGTAAELTASPFANGTRGCWRSFPNRARVPVGEELFPIT
jgi:hypothetical protein